MAVKEVEAKRCWVSLCIARRIETGAQPTMRQVVSQRCLGADQKVKTATARPSGNRQLLNAFGKRTPCSAVRLCPTQDLRPDAPWLQR